MFFYRLFYIYTELNEIKVILFYKDLTIIIAAPRTAKTIPVTRLSFRADVLLANTAETLAPIRVNNTQQMRAVISGREPMAKWETAPVRALKVIINTLVPTAVLSL